MHFEYPVKHVMRKEFPMTRDSGMIHHGRHPIIHILTKTILQKSIFLMPSGWMLAAKFGFQMRTDRVSFEYTACLT